MKAIKEFKALSLAEKAGVIFNLTISVVMVVFIALAIRPITSKVMMITEDNTTYTTTKYYALGVDSQGNIVLSPVADEEVELQ